MKRKVLNKQNNSRFCFVCGTENDFGLKASFFEIENDMLVASFTPSKFHQGYPGRLHGGIASAVLDEAMGRAILLSDDKIWGVTVELNVNFKKPVPLNSQIKLVCKLTDESSRMFEAKGKILLENGDAAVVAHGKYLKLSLSKITDVEFADDQWFEVKNENDPNEFEIPNY